MVRRARALVSLATVVLLWTPMARAEERYTARVQSLVPSEGVKLKNMP